MVDEKAGTTVKKKVGRPPKARGAPNSSDASDARWTVRGVPLNVRAIANKCSDNKGMTVGDWLAEAIVSYSRSDKPGISAAENEVSAGGNSNIPAIPLSGELKDVLQTIQERLDKIEAEKKKPFIVRLFGGQS